jgi:hypothetical protein
VPSCPEWRGSPQAKTDGERHGASAPSVRTVRVEMRYVSCLCVGLELALSSGVVGQGLDILYATSAIHTAAGKGLLAECRKLGGCNPHLTCSLVMSARRTSTMGGWGCGVAPVVGFAAVALGARCRL